MLTLGQLMKSSAIHKFLVSDCGTKSKLSTAYTGDTRYQ